MFKIKKMKTIVIIYLLIGLALILSPSICASGHYILDIEQIESDTSVDYGIGHGTDGIDSHLLNGDGNLALNAFPR